MELVSFVPCRYAELKPDGWQMNGAFFAEVTFRDFPSVVPTFKVMAVFAQNVGDKEKEDFELAIVDATGDPVHGVFRKFATFDKYGKAIIEMEFMNVTIPRPGGFLFELRFSGVQCRPWVLFFSKGQAA